MPTLCTIKSQVEMAISFVHAPESLRNSADADGIGGNSLAVWGGEKEGSGRSGPNGLDPGGKGTTPDPTPDFQSGPFLFSDLCQKNVWKSEK